MKNDNPCLLKSFEFGHFDERVSQDVDNGSPCLTHHVGHNHHCQRQAGQHNGMDLLPKRHLRIDVGDAGEDNELHGKQSDQNIGDKEFRKGDRAERHYGNRSIEKTVAVKCCRNPQKNRNRHCDNRSHNRQEKTVAKAPPDQPGYGPSIGQ